MRIKPPGGGTSIEYHQDRNYISEQFTPLENNSITCWIPLDDGNNVSVIKTPQKMKFFNILVHGTELYFSISILFKKKIMQSDIFLC